MADGSEDCLNISNMEHQNTSFYFIIGDDSLSTLILVILRSPEFINFMAENYYNWHIMMAGSDDALEFFEIFAYGLPPILYVISALGIPIRVVELAARIRSNMVDERPVFAALTALVRGSPPRDSEENAPREGNASSVNSVRTSSTESSDDSDLYGAAQLNPCGEIPNVEPFYLQRAALVQQDSDSDESTPRNRFQDLNGTTIRIIVPDSEHPLLILFVEAEPLNTVHNRLADMGFRNFVLMRSHPRRPYTAQEYSTSLQDLELVPDGTVFIKFLPDRQSPLTITIRNMTSLFWFLTSPLTRMYEVMTAFLQNIFRSPAALMGQENAQMERQNAPMEQQNPMEQQSAPAPRVRRLVSNVHTLRDIHRRDDDDNNTYNGNSTQQK